MSLNDYLIRSQVLIEMKYWFCRNPKVRLTFLIAYITPAAVHGGIGSLLGFCIDVSGLCIRLLRILKHSPAEPAST